MQMQISKSCKKIEFFFEENRKSAPEGLRNHFRDVTKKK